MSNLTPEQELKEARLRSYDRGRRDEAGYWRPRMALALIAMGLLAFLVGAATAKGDDYVNWMESAETQRVINEVRLGAESLR